MIHLDNDAILELLPMSEVMDALRIGFDQLATSDGVLVPRLELWSPAAQEDGYYCLGSMSGATKHFGYAAIRIKSDVLYWPEGKRQEKYAKEPGTYCGFIMLFSTATGEPVALINDGVLQRMRVGGSAGVAAGHLAKPGLNTVGMLGAGDMARTYLEAISLSCELDTVKVFSPTQANREKFAEEMSGKLGLSIEPVASPQEAVGERDIVFTATNSMIPTLQPEWISKGSTVLCVTRRELSPELVDGADKVMQLGVFSLSPDANVPDMEFVQSASAAFVAGNEEERARLPWKNRAEKRDFPSFIDMLRGETPGRTSSDETILFVNVGTQGVQFATVAGRAYDLAVERGLGAPMNQGQFLQDIRD
jgi:alanine dehydrogenase